MNPISNYKELLDVQRWSIRSESEYWYMFLIFNPLRNKSSKAALEIIDAYEYLNERSEHIDFFLPGFSNGLNGNGVIMPYRQSKRAILLGEYESIGKIYFDEKSFVETIKFLQDSSGYYYRYSEECDLLLLKYNKVSSSFDFNTLCAYNLDDITKNGSVSIIKFLSDIVGVTLNNQDMVEIKRKIDLNFYDAIIPNLSREQVEFLSNRIPKNNFTFISYASKRFDSAKNIQRILSRNGISTWMAPNDIAIGESYASMIETAIQHSANFVLILTNEAIESIWVEKELDRAIGKHGRQNIIVVDCDECIAKNRLKYGYPYYLTNIQAKSYDEYVEILETNTAKP